MQTFSKAERLCSKVLIDQLVESGKSFNCFPFRIIWKSVEKNESPVKIVISVPKRIYKRAVDRNTIKRLVREVYRKNKAALYADMASQNIHLMLIYTSKTILEYSEFEDKITEVLKRLNKELKLATNEKNTHSI